MGNGNLEKLIEQLGDIHVLYIEDTPDIQCNMVELLNIYFPNVDVASDGEAGIRKYRSFYEKHALFYDLILTDINMPKMNGLEMIRQIKEINDRQLFVVMSAHNETNYLLEMIDLEVAHYILKPIDITRFEKVMGHALEILLQRRNYHKMTEELARSKRLAEEATAQKSRFLANMSHEIRTPLNAITGFIALLENDEADPTKQKYLKIIKNASESLLQIINDILDLSKIESGKLKIQPDTFNPYDDLIVIAELFQAKAAEKNIQFQIRYNTNMPETLYGDVLRIKQIFSNLLSNAIKFTPEGSKVKCVVWYKNGMLNIRVKDYGIGISKEKQETIFKPFVQADASTERVYGGTGLGLTISMELAKMLGGDLTLESEEGRGSVFTLSIPIPEGKSEVKEKETLHTSLKGHVLIVEDYEANRMLLSIMLDNLGLTYDMAYDGIEAIEKFREGKYDVILMDENMPRMGGMEAMKEIVKIEHEKHLPHTPIVSLTANALQGDRERFLEAGFDDYLSKPIDPETLSRSLSKFLGN